MSETKPAVDPADLAFVRERRVGRLATADAEGTPSVVPVCYALVEGDGGPTIVTPLDAKPKTVDWRGLRRVRNIEARPAVSFVVDDYNEDWTRLAWVLVRGRARLVEPGTPLPTFRSPSWTLNSISEALMSAIRFGTPTVA